MLSNVYPPGWKWTVRWSESWKCLLQLVTVWLSLMAWPFRIPEGRPSVHRVASVRSDFQFLWEKVMEIFTANIFRYAARVQELLP